MNFIELTRQRPGVKDQKVLYDFDSGWEIMDRGPEPAWWCNDREGRNFSAADTYESLRARFALVSPMLRSTPGERDE